MREKTARDARRGKLASMAGRPILEPAIGRLIISIFQIINLENNREEGQFTLNGYFGYNLEKYGIVACV
jgi:hypothetical protein